MLHETYVRKLRMIVITYNYDFMALTTNYHTNSLHASKCIKSATVIKLLCRLCVVLCFFCILQFLFIYNMLGFRY